MHGEGLRHFSENQIYTISNSTTTENRGSENYHAL